jgi:hypothetical protein
VSQKASGTDRTLTSRFECKYMVRHDLVPALRQAIAPFVQPDRHARHMHDYRYAVCSLYLDSPGNLFYRQSTTGEKNRFKLRVRTYGDRPEDPAFFEIKKRINGIISKSRVVAERGRATDVLRALAWCPSGAPLARNDDLREFLHLSRRTGAVPRVRIRYMREAYESVSVDPVRVTFDTALCHALTTDANLLHGGPNWSPTPTDGTILEIKYTQIFPAWLGDVVRCFDLERQSISKYVHAIDGSRSLPRLWPGLEAL